MNGWVNGLLCNPAMRIYPPYTDTFFEKPGVYTFTVPRGAKRIDVTCIGGGGAGGVTGYDYGAGGTPGTGGDGGTGDMAHAKGYAVSPGMVFNLAVGAGGTLSLAAETSWFGEIAYAKGGENGAEGAWSDLSNDIYAVVPGGKGGDGGIGGGRGDSGINRKGKDWGGGENGADRLDWTAWTRAQWYCFGDMSTGRRLGNAGDDYISAGYPPRGRTDLPGRYFGSGGEGTKRKEWISRTDGGGGLVAVRVWYR